MRSQHLTSVFILLAAFTAASAQEAAPGMMSKSESGVPLHSEVDLAMCHPDGVAIGGYDAVSYRQPGGPIMGTADYEREFDGRIYRFASEDNLSTFDADPQRYLPAYSGFCAITLALGRVVCPDYTNFQIDNDRLYLFEITGFTNGRTLWNSNADGFRQRANENYSRLLDLQ